jgi:hypothetical protein
MQRQVPRAARLSCICRTWDRAVRYCSTHEAILQGSLHLSGVCTNMRDHMHACTHARVKPRHTPRQPPTAPHLHAVYLSIGFATFTPHPLVGLSTMPLLAHTSNVAFQYHIHNPIPQLLTRPTNFSAAKSCNGAGKTPCTCVLCTREKPKIRKIWQNATFNAVVMHGMRGG